MISGQLLIMTWALVVASMVASYGRGHQFEALYFVLIVIFGAVTVEQLTILTFLLAVLVMYNEFMRGSRP